MHSHKKSSTPWTRNPQKLFSLSRYISFAENFLSKMVKIQISIFKSTCFNTIVRRKPEILARLTATFL